jgi:hypothetical protein
MEKRFRRFIRRLTRTSSSGPGALVLSNSRLLPSPWETWTLLAIVRYRDRLRWAQRLYHALLLRQSPSVTPEESFRLLEKLPDFGVVPGDSRWEYRIHGCNVRFRHRRTGEQVSPQSPERIDRYLFLDYVRTSDGSVAKTLRTFHRSEMSIVESLQDLVEAGVLLAVSSGLLELRLSPEASRHENLLRAFGQAWARREHRPPLALWIGDPVTAYRLARRTGGRLVRRTRKLADACRRRRAERLRDALAAPGPESARALYALADLNVPDLPAHLVRALGGDMDSRFAALRIIADKDAVALCPAVFDLMTGPDACSDERTLAAGLLLRHNYRRGECLEALAASASESCGNASILALEHAPALARVLLCRGLRSRDTRRAAAVILGLLDVPWSRQTLASALEESDDPTATAAIRVALKGSQDGDVRSLAESWELAHLGEVQVEPSFAAKEAEWEMERMHDQVYRLRSRVPE